VVWLQDPLPALAKLARHRDLVGMISAHYKARKKKEGRARLLRSLHSVDFPFHTRSRAFLCVFVCK